MVVTAIVENIEEFEDDNYGPGDGVCARCIRCGNATEAYGISESSVRACLAILRERCPRGENNFYVVEK